MGIESCIEKAEKWEKYGSWVDMGVMSGIERQLTLPGTPLKVSNSRLS
jgi:hypothetical protein